MAPGGAGRSDGDRGRRGDRSSLRLPGPAKPGSGTASVTWKEDPGGGDPQVDAQTCHEFKKRLRLPPWRPGTVPEETRGRSDRRCPLQPAEHLRGRPRRRCGWLPRALRSGKLICDRKILSGCSKTKGECPRSFPNPTRIRKVDLKRRLPFNGKSRSIRTTALAKTLIIPHIAFNV